MSRPELSLVLLAYKAGASIRPFVEEVMAAFTRAGIKDYELILVGNYVEGGRDTTPDVVAALAGEHKCIRYCAVPKQGWMGWDMRMGLNMAEGQYIAVMDGDGQMPVEDAVNVYQEIRRGGLDLVKTYRISRGDGPLRKTISYVYNLVFCIFFPGPCVRDVNSKPKIMTRAAYEQLVLTSDDWFIDTEIVIQARRLRLKLGAIPTTFLGLTGRRSFISYKAVLEFLKNLIMYRIREPKRHGRV